MKVLIAGLGSIGRRHLRNLLALGQDDIVLYHTGHSTLPEDELAPFAVETDLKAALDHRPEAVIVANPNSLHLEVAIPAAEQGCHLLIEKPLSHTMEGVERLRQAVRSGGGQVLVGFQFRFHPGLQKVKQLISSTPPPLTSKPSPPASTIGRPLSVHAHWGEYMPGWHPWEDYRHGYSARADLGGGAILSLCHPLDYLRWLFGEVEALWAFAGRLGELELDVEDTAEIGLRFADGMLGSVHLDYNQRPPAHTLEVIGTQGMLRWDSVDGAVNLYQSPTPLSPPPAWVPVPPPAWASVRHRRATPVRPWPRAGKEKNNRDEGEGWRVYPAPAGFERNDLFLAEMRHFLAVARGEEQPICSLEDGIQALRLAVSARRSAETGQMVMLRSE